MPKSIDILARAYSLELLTALNDQPHVNKELLFADAVAYYRWLYADKKAMDALAIYWHEFQAHHKALVANMEPEVRVGCFITWFVEQRFHTLPPLSIANVTEEQQRQLVQRTRFSQPSFHLPTGDPVETYLMQWLYWHLDNPPVDGARTEDARLFRWSCELANEVKHHEFKDGEYTTLLSHCARFFAWCRNDLRSWDAFMDLFVAFLHSEVGLAANHANPALVDACFINWFCQTVLAPAEQNQSEPVVPQDRDG